MLDTKDIINLLREGQSMDDIAAQLTAKLNDAQAEYEKEVLAKKEAEDKKVLDQRVKAAAILDAFAAYMMAYHPDSDLLEDVDFSSPEAIDRAVDAVIDGIDQAVELYTQITKLSDLFGGINIPLVSSDPDVPTVKKVAAKPKKDAPISANDIISRFCSMW